MNYAYWLANIKGLGRRKLQRLMRQVCSAQELYEMTEKQLDTLGLNEKEKAGILAAHKREEQIKQSYESMKERGIRFLSWEDEAYPKRLRQLADAPYGLYAKGVLPPEEKKAVAVVGARRCSEYGYAVAKTLASRLAANGVTVISGMALGIDAAGHKGALSCNGITTAVLGCGVDVCYPSGNRGLYLELEKKGGILSEYPPGTEPIPGFFPERNRIIAGLCDVLVVVEAKERSGSLITADCALELGKDVYAVPGRICDPLSGGTNMLIRQGAGIVSGMEDFLNELRIFEQKEENINNFKNLLLEKEERIVYSCLDLQPKCMEELLGETGLSMQELSGALAGLARKRLAEETFKNCYVRRT
ncbi:MAG: DNA-processing protein DprA [Clostridiales bacterium]|nr:DNA-processing protein DprA [Clostridiales bacterium]